MGIRWRLAALGTTVLGTVLLGGCTQESGTGNGVASLSTPNTSSSAAVNAGQTDEDKARAFGKCMREHGVDIADPQAGSGQVQIRVTGGHADQGKLEAAVQACRSLMPGGGTRGPVSAQDLDRARAQAKCLREHGLNVPDPTADNPKIRLTGNTIDKAKLNAAVEACHTSIGGGGR